MVKASTVVDTLHSCWRVYEYMICMHGPLSMSQLSCIRSMLPTVSNVITVLYVIRGKPNLCVRAHRDGYNFASRIFRDELLAEPQTQGGPFCLYLCVCVCVLCTRQLVCVLTCAVDKCIQLSAHALTFAYTEIQNTTLTSTKSGTDMPSGHGVRRTCFDAVTPSDELASDRIGNLSRMMQALMNSWTS